jgi:hypothetical protein
MSGANGKKQAEVLTVNLDAWLQKSVAQARLKFIDVCLEAAEMVIEKTPVDTGFCRAMWSVSINAEPMMAPKARPAEWKTLVATAAGAQAVAEITTGALAAQISDRVWIYNPVVYAPALEDGHSQQAPSGMVAVTVGFLRAKYA